MDAYDQLNEEHPVATGQLPEDDELLGPLPQIPIGIVMARILIVSGMSFAAAVGIFMLIAAIWLWATVGFAVAIVFMFLMFAVERLAD